MEPVGSSNVSYVPIPKIAFSHSPGSAPEEAPEGENPQKSCIDKIAKFTKNQIQIHIIPFTRLIRYFIGIPKALDLLNAVGSVADGILMVAGATKLASGLQFIIRPHRIWHNIKKIIAANSLSEKVRIAFETVLTASALTNSFTSFLNGLVAIRILSASSIAWSLTLKACCYPFLVLQCGVEWAKLIKVIEVHGKVSKLFPTLESNAPQEVREQTLIAFYENIRARNVSEYNGKIAKAGFNLSKKYGLDQRMESIIGKLKSQDIEMKKEGTEEGAHFMSILKRRAHCKLASQSLRTAFLSIISTCVGMNVLTLPVLPIVPAALLLAGAVTAFARYVIDTFVLMKNPDDPSWPVHAYEWIHIKAQEAKIKAQALFCRNVPAAAAAA